MRYLLARTTLSVIALAVVTCDGPNLDDTTWRCTTSEDCGDGFVCASGLGACVRPDNSAPGVSSGSIVVGMTGPLATGDTAAGQAVRRGMEAYFAFINRQGGLDGRQVEVRAVDDGGDPAVALTNVQQLVESGEVFAFVGNVGTESARTTTPYLVEQRRLVLGTVSGSATLRKTPPDRYVFNLRPSVSEEISSGLGYLTSNRERLIPVSNIAVFAEGESDLGVPNEFGQEGVDAVQAALRTEGFSGNVTIGTHTRNTSDVNNAVSTMLQWLAEERVADANGNISAAIILVTTARPAASFVRILREELARIRSGDSNGAAFGLSAEQVVQLFSVDDVTFFSISGVGVDQLTAELSTFGSFQTVAGQRSFCEPVVASQVVPPIDGSASGIIQYRDHLRLLDSTLVPTSLGLEGYLLARIFSEAVLANGPALSTEGVIDTLEGLQNLDFGTGVTLGFSPSTHQATNQVFGADVTATCDLESLELGEPIDDPDPMPSDCVAGVCTITGVITQDRTLTADFRWLLTGTVFVGDGTTPTVLTIAPGTTVLGDKATTGTLVVRRGSRIEAIGTREAPIVFTSAEPPGSRAAGDWGGVIINGRAPINDCALDPDDCVAFNQAFGEGGTGFYGGNNPDDDSGELRYVRIEFAGKLLSPENELNGLALQGVGRGTVLDFIQIHRGQDDGIEFFGGTVDFKHVLVTGALDDSFDWTEGWTGRGQYLIAQQWPDDSDNGIEADNNDPDRDNQPRSRPILSNLTIVGSPASEASDYGMLLREGTSAEIHNSIVLGFNDACIDIDHPETWAVATTTSTATTLVFRNSIISCETNFEDEAEDPVTIENFVTMLNAGNSVLPTTEAILSAPFDTVSPDMRPTSGSAAESGAVPLSDTFFDAATYVGAVDPQADWTLGWTTNVED